MHEMIIRKIGFKLYYKVVPHYIIKSMAHYSKMVICSTNTALLEFTNLNMTALYRRSIVVKISDCLNSIIPLKTTKTAENIKNNNLLSPWTVSFDQLDIIFLANHI